MRISRKGGAPLKFREIGLEIARAERETIRGAMDPIYEILSCPTQRESVKTNSMKEAKKEGFCIAENCVEGAINNFKTLLREDVEYIPGFADEYVEKIRNLFYSSKKVSVKKISTYIVEKSL